MSRIRLDRKPIEFDSGSSVQQPRQLPIWTPTIGKGKLDLQFLECRGDGRKLIETLIDWQGAKRGGYSVGLDVRRFLKYVIEAEVEIGASSLLAYRQKLESDPALQDGTRRSYYSNAAAFTNRLMLRGVIPEEDLPPGLSGVQTRPKATFSEAAKNWEEIVQTREFADWKERASAVPGLDSASREVLAVSEGWLNLLEYHAACVVEQQIKDWSFASSLIASRDGSHATWPELRSVDTALCFLYESFGPLLPASTRWPPGIVDFCKWRGWTPDRLKAALFPTAKALDAFLVLALANSRLMPNVDSVLYYAFVGCVTDTDDSALVRVCFKKFRGGAADDTVNKRSSLALGLRALESVVVGVLGDTRDLPDLYRDGGVPLFLHYSGSDDREGVRRLDPSMAAHMVRRFIRKSAQKYPVLAPLVNKVTGENFRTTHILCRGLHGQSIFGTQSDAGHKSASTTARYQDRVEVEASVAQRHLGYQRYLLEEAKASSARRLGNGFHCKPQEKVHEECLRTDACGLGPSGCSARRVVLESPKIVAEWIAWSGHIRGHEDYLRVHRPERWEKVWAPRLLDYEVLLERVSTTVRRQAEQYVEKVVLLPLE